MSIPASYTRHPFKIMEMIYEENRQVQLSDSD